MILNSASFHEKTGDLICFEVCKAYNGGKNIKNLNPTIHYSLPIDEFRVDKFDGENIDHEIDGE